MQPIQKQRNSNLELYRIIVMLLIVAHHSVFHSGVMEEMAQNPLCAKSIFFYVFGMWGRTGIDCFVLITGYFMCKSHITIQKYLKLLLEVIFYNVVIYGIFVAMGKLAFSVNELFWSKRLNLPSVPGTWKSWLVLSWIRLARNSIPKRSWVLVPRWKA